jgi:diacylglycerol kinase
MKTIGMIVIFVILILFWFMIGRMGAIILFIIMIALFLIVQIIQTYLEDRKNKLNNKNKNKK